MQAPPPSPSSPTFVDYPVCLRLTGRQVLVVGGGVVASGRVTGLLAAGASVRVVAPEVQPEIAAAAERGELALSRRGFRAADLDGAMLLVVAIDDPLQSEQIASAAKVRGLLCTVADKPALCDFTMPSVGRRGPITVAVSTSGKAPALAARLRRRFEAQLGPEDVAIASAIDALRGQLPAGPARMRFLRRLTTAADLAATAVRKVARAAAGAVAATTGATTASGGSR
jgi:precorrin-2 dehydrogenase / sirohydrochlorin ferrochelatase